MSNILVQWIESRGNEALQKVLHDETLIFEEEIVLTMVANREVVQAHCAETKGDYFGQYFVERSRRTTCEM
jgi:hypothetical protein